MEVYPLVVHAFTVWPRRWRVKDFIIDAWALLPIIAIGMVGVGLVILTIWVTITGLYLGFTDQSISY